MASDLSLYNATPFTIISSVDQVDTFVATGSSATFTLVNNTAATLGSTIQAGNIEYYQFNGGFTNNGDGTFTLATIPPVGTQIVAPGQIQITAAAFDQASVLGVTNPQQVSVPVWLVDTDTINNYKYLPLPAYPGIQISCVQLISGSNAQPSWISMASANASGNALSFGASGAPLYLPQLDAATSLFTIQASGFPPGTTALVVQGATGSLAGNAIFWPGQYIAVNVGNPTSEILHVIGVYASPTPGQSILYIDPSGTTYTHYNFERVFACGWKFWIQMNVPLNANNNTAINLYNLSIQRLGAIQARP